MMFVERVHRLLACGQMPGAYRSEHFLRHPLRSRNGYQGRALAIKFGYRCFDRILLNGLIQFFQQPERVIGFFNAYRGGERFTRSRLRDIAQQFQNWVKNRCEKWGTPILDAPAGRRDDFVDPY